MVLDLTLHQVPPSPPRGLFDVSKYKYHINISLNAVVRRTTDNPDMTLSPPLTHELLQEQRLRESSKVDREEEGLS